MVSLAPDFKGVRADVTPYISDADFTLYVGDVRDCLRGLPDESVHCVVTSPPYWSLRDYQTEGQLGLEPTPELYVENMVAVFRQVRRVLRRDGTLWLNIGDSYASVPGSQSQGANGQMADRSVVRARAQVRDGKAASGMGAPQRPPGVSGIKPKDLVGVPWRLAFALQQDGWYLRSEITWCKRNCMPESVTDRPTKATEKVFLLTRSPTYFYDQDAVREPHSPDGRAVTTLPVGPNSHENHAGRNGHERWPGAGRNMRDFWLLATEPYPDAHFATFPQALVEPCVKAGTSERGCCPECGAPWERETTVEQERLNGNKGRATQKPGANNWAGVDARTIKHVETIGWKPSCSRDCLGADYTPVPCTVLDPFMGSGTVALVSRKLGRRSVGIELNQAYAELAAKRLGQQSLFAEGVA